MSTIPPYKGDGDYLSDAALDKILELTELLPDFELGPNSNATPTGITCTLKFPGGIFEQSEHLDRVLRASTVAGTLARNLRHERDCQRQASAQARPSADHTKEA